MRRTTTLHNLGVRDVRQLALFCSENPSLCLDIMKISSPFLVSPAMMTMVLITAAAAAAIAVILLASNFAIANAQLLPLDQQQEQQELEESDGGGLTAILNGDRQPTAIQSTTLFQSANDSFSIQVPQGWIIHDLNNTGSALSEDEVTQGYGVLAQLCPEEEEQQEQGAVPTLPNAGGGSGDTFSCEGSENYVIHIVRYHDLDTRLPAANNATTSSNNNIMTNDNILLYHLQKLQEVGYRGVQIVNSADMTVNLTNPQTNQTIATVPAQFVEMTYSTASASNETKSGYLISTATNITAPNLGMTKGYTIFYEGSSFSAAEPTIGFGSLQQLPPAVKQVFYSFELIVAPEVAAEAAEPAEGGDGGENDGDDVDDLLLFWNVS
jgi:hypothetical protein